ncbi:MAG: GntR family transcriptional regulator [Hyphomicrobium sp.]
MRKSETLDMQTSKIHAAPLYSQLSNVFRDLIRQEKWPVGIALPSETDLARRYGVSVGTARKALESLQGDGWITRRQGRGTFVADPAEQQLDRFCRIFVADTGVSFFTDCTPVMIEKIEDVATPQEAKDLGILPNSAVVRLHRRMDRKGTAVLLEKQVLRADMFPDIHKRAELPANLYSLFLRDFGIEIQRCVESITSINADESLSEQLGVKVGQALLYSKRKIEDSNGRIVGLIERWFQTSNTTYQVSLTA